MAKRSARERLLDIAGCIAKVERFLKNRSFEDFRTDAMLHDAVVRNFEIISEASRHIPPGLKDLATQIPWSDIAGAGNILRHGYEGVSDIILWDTIHRDLPVLKTAIHSLLDDPEVD